MRTDLDLYRLLFEPINIVFDSYTHLHQVYLYQIEYNRTNSLYRVYPMQILKQNSSFLETHTSFQRWTHYQILSHNRSHHLYENNTFPHLHCMNSNSRLKHLLDAQLIYCIKLLHNLAQSNHPNRQKLRRSQSFYLILHFVHQIVHRFLFRYK